MRVIESEDRFGKSCFIFPKSATINQVQDWLISNCPGYIFATLIDLSRDEFHNIDEIVVNFFHDLADEAIEASGDMCAITVREKTMISQYLRDHGTTWEKVTRR